MCGPGLHDFIPIKEDHRICYVCGQKYDHAIHKDGAALTAALELEKKLKERLSMAGSDKHAFIQSKNFARICETCGRECNDYEYHFPTYGSEKWKDYRDAVNDKVAFEGGATSGGIEAPYFFMTWVGVDLMALRYGYGNQKHEDGTLVLAEANWLKSFHSRDVQFFRDRAAHAIKHIQKEMSGHTDPAPGGNWGAVGWCQDVMPFVAKYDPDFYAAIVGLRKHPGKRLTSCTCPRCEAANHQVPAIQGKPNDPA